MISRLLHCKRRMLYQVLRQYGIYPRKRMYDILIRDSETVTATLGDSGNELIAKTLLCITHRDIIDSIRERCPELYVDVDTTNYDVVSYASNHEFCPFIDTTTRRCVDSHTIPNYSNKNFIITNLTTGARLNIDMLLIHLIYHHHFYQISYKISPVDLMQFLDLPQRSNNE